MSNAYDVQAPGDRITSVSKFNEVTAAQGQVDGVALYPEGMAQQVVFLAGGVWYRRSKRTGVAVSGASCVATIQAAINSLTGARTFREVVYVKDLAEINDTITVPSYTILYFNHLKVADSTDKDAIQNSDQVGGNTDIEIYIGKLDGNKANQALGRGIEFINVTEYEIEGYIKDCEEEGIYLSSCNRGRLDARVSDCDAANIYLGTCSQVDLDVESYGSTTIGFQTSACEELVGTIVTYSNTTHGIQLAGACQGINIDIVSSTNTQSGVRLATCTGPAIITGVVKDNVQNGITVETTTLFTLDISAEGNDSGASATYDDLEIDDSSYCTIRGIYNSANVVYNINESGTSDYNTIKQVVARQGTIVTVGEHTIGDLDPHLTVDIDLSGGAVDYDLWHARCACTLLGYYIQYTEVTTFDVGKNIRIGRYQDGVALDNDYFDISVSEVSKAKGYRKYFASADLTQTVIAAGDSITAGTAGGKNDTGEVRIILNLVEMSG